MSDCCASQSPKTNPTAQPCPQCGESCKPVAVRTLYHQVKFPGNQSIPPANYYFCPNKACVTAYFSDIGNSIPKQQLTTFPDILNDKLCFCFDITSADYQAALTSNGADAIKNFVIDRTKLGECACEIRNPSGQCCLAMFKHMRNL